MQRLKNVAKLAKRQSLKPCPGFLWSLTGQLGCMNMTFLLIRFLKRPDQLGCSDGSKVAAGFFTPLHLICKALDTAQSPKELLLKHTVRNQLGKSQAYELSFHNCSAECMPTQQNTFSRVQFPFGSRLKTAFSSLMRWQRQLAQGSAGSLVCSGDLEKEELCGGGSWKVLQSMRTP